MNVSRGPAASTANGAMWVLSGTVAGIVAMLITGLPEGDRDDLLAFVAVGSLAISAGSFVTGFRHSRQESRRNLVRLLLGALLGVAVVAYFNVVTTRVNFVEAASHILLAMGGLGGYLALGGALLGNVGLYWGRRLRRAHGVADSTPDDE